MCLLFQGKSYTHLICSNTSLAKFLNSIGFFHNVKKQHLESVSKQLHFLKASLFSIYLTILFLNVNVFKFFEGWLLLYEYPAACSCNKLHIQIRCRGICITLYILPLSIFKKNHADRLCCFNFRNMKYCVPPGVDPSSGAVVWQQEQFATGVTEHILTQRLQRTYISICICTVCCGFTLDCGSCKERGVTLQLPPCHIDRSLTQSYSIFYLIKCKVATPIAGGTGGKSQQVNLQLLAVHGCVQAGLIESFA